MSAPVPANRKCRAAGLPRDRSWLCSIHSIVLSSSSCLRPSRDGVAIVSQSSASQACVPSYLSREQRAPEALLVEAVADMRAGGRINSMQTRRRSHSGEIKRCIAPDFRSTGQAGAQSFLFFTYAEVPPSLSISYAPMRIFEGTGDSSRGARRACPRGVRRV